MQLQELDDSRNEKEAALSKLRASSRVKKEATAWASLDLSTHILMSEPNARGKGLSPGHFLKFTGGLFLF